ncbi:MAG: spore germination protein [Bacillota bacterium]|jgi:spore germination protein KA
MLRFLLRKLNFRHRLNQNTGNGKNHTQVSTIFPNVKKNITFLRNTLGVSNDIVYREFTIGTIHKKNAALIYVDGLVTIATVQQNILQPLMFDTRITRLDINSINEIPEKILSIGDVKEVCTMDEVLEGILSGDTVLFLEDSKTALVLSTRGWKARSIESPPTEEVVRGPREGFTETLRTNTSLLRRKIKNPNLIFETITVGKRTKTDVCLVYIKGFTNPHLVEEIKRRLNRIDTDSILESGYIEQFIEDAPLSPFATMGNSEKPDIVAARIMEGRAAIIVDGTPIVLTVPMLFIESFQSPEDYYSRPYYASMVRSLRFLAFLISILGPAIYVALASYHHELIPTQLVVTMAAASEGTPFPALVEAVGMGIVFEILREAGIRLPRPVGQAISIVGALVIGDAAVSAGLIGAPMVIVVAITAISSFVVPPHSDSGSILRITFAIMAGVLGAFGIIIGLLGILIYLASLRSFGVPYLSPLTPLSIADLKDTFIRFPLWAMFKRPKALNALDRERQAFRLKPKPPSD